MQQLIDLRHETPEAISLQAIGSFMQAGRPAIVLFSGGKDSSVLLNLALTAASEQAKQGRKPDGGKLRGQACDGLCGLPELDAALHGGVLAGTK